MTHNIDTDRLRKLVVTRRTYGAALRDIGQRRRGLVEVLGRLVPHLEEAEANPRSSESQLEAAKKAVADARQSLAALDREEEEASDRFSLAARLADRGRDFAVRAGVCPLDLMES